MYNAQDHGLSTVTRSASAVLEHTPSPPLDGEAAQGLSLNLDELIQAKFVNVPEAIEKEAVKGYGIVFVGIGQPISGSTPRFEHQLQRLIDIFEGPVAITLNGQAFSPEPGSAFRILVPTGGTSHDRLATEIALALARATKGSLTVLHVFDPQEDTNLLKASTRRAGISVLANARRLGKRSGVHVDVLTAENPRPEMAVLRAASEGGYDLLVFAASLRAGDKKFLGPRSTTLVRAIEMSTLLVAQ